MMRAFHIQRGVAVVIAAAILCAAPAARAGDVARARELFKQAEEHYANKAYASALDKYRAAYDIKPLAGFHFNIGQCHRHMGQHEKAVFHFRKYLSLSKRAKHREEAERLIKLSEEELAQKRQADARADALLPPPAKAPPPKVVVKKKSGGLPRLKPIYFWSGVGLTGVLLLTATITGAVALSKSSDYNDPATPYNDLQELKDSGESHSTASTLMFCLGLTAAAGTVALYFFTDFGSKERAVSVAPLDGGGMVSWGGSF